MKSSKSRIQLPEIALPWHQQLVMRLYMGPFVASSSEIKKNREVYQSFSQKIIDLGAGIPFSQHSVPVLVPAQVGLLDDTRYWSIAMTLEHLLKLDAKTKEIILKLARGEAPNIKVTPKNVAPTGKMDPEKVFADFKAFVPTHLDEIDELLVASKSELTEVHPIFGPFTARQWYWSLATRTSLRYRQLKNIRRGLTFDPASERQLNLLPESPDV